MAMMNIKTIAKYIPPVAVVLAVYQAYAQRGVQGLMDDIKDLPNMITYKEDLTRLAVGAVIVVAGHWAVQKFVPAGIIRYVALGVVYYAGSSMILQAFASGRAPALTGFFGSAGATPQTAATQPLQGMI
jgi:hypothetical protein